MGRHVNSHPTVGYPDSGFQGFPKIYQGNSTSRDSTLRNLQANTFLIRYLTHPDLSQKKKTESEIKLIQNLLNFYVFYS